MTTPTPTSTPQPAADRRAAEAELQGLVEKYAAEHAPLITATRKWILKRLPSAHEVVYEYRGFFVISYSPSGHGYEGALALRADEHGVRLYFQQAKNLPDPAKLLKGSAQARWIDLASPATLKDPAVDALTQAALARHAVPFAAKGRGSITVRPTSAKKRAARRKP